MVFKRLTCIVLTGALTFTPAGLGLPMPEALAIDVSDIRQPLLQNTARAAREIQESVQKGSEAVVAAAHERNLSKLEQEIKEQNEPEKREKMLKSLKEIRELLKGAHYPEVQKRVADIHEALEQERVKEEQRRARLPVDFKEEEEDVFTPLSAEQLKQLEQACTYSTPGIFPPTADFEVCLGEVNEARFRITFPQFEVKPEGEGVETESSQYLVLELEGANVSEWAKGLFSGISLYDPNRSLILHPYRFGTITLYYDDLDKAPLTLEAPNPDSPDSVSDQIYSVEGLRAIDVTVFGDFRLKEVRLGEVLDPGTYGNNLAVSLASRLPFYPEAFSTQVRSFPLFQDGQLSATLLSVSKNSITADLRGKTHFILPQARSVAPFNRGAESESFVAALSLRPQSSCGCLLYSTLHVTAATIKTGFQKYFDDVSGWLLSPTLNDLDSIVYRAHRVYRGFLKPKLDPTGKYPLTFFAKFYQPSKDPKFHPAGTAYYQADPPPIEKEIPFSTERSFGIASEGANYCTMTGDAALLFACRHDLAMPVVGSPGYDFLYEQRPTCPQCCAWNNIEGRSTPPGRGWCSGSEEEVAAWWTGKWKNTGSLEPTLNPLAALQSCPAPTPVEGAPEEPEKIAVSLLPTTGVDFGTLPTPESEEKPYPEAIREVRIQVLREKMSEPISLSLSVEPNDVFQVMGARLYHPVEPSSAKITQSSGATLTLTPLREVAFVTLKFKPTEIKDYEGKLTVKGAGIETATIPLFGSVSGECEAIAERLEKEILSPAESRLENGKLFGFPVNNNSEGRRLLDLLALTAQCIQKKYLDNEELNINPELRFKVGGLISPFFVNGNVHRLGKSYFDHLVLTVEKLHAINRDSCDEYPTTSWKNPIKKLVENKSSEFEAYIVPQLYELLKSYADVHFYDIMLPSDPVTSWAKLVESKIWLVTHPLAQTKQRELDLIYKIPHSLYETFGAFVDWASATADESEIFVLPSPGHSPLEEMESQAPKLNTAAINTKEAVDRIWGEIQGTEGPESLTSTLVSDVERAVGDSSQELAQEFHANVVIFAHLVDRLQIYFEGLEGDRDKEGGIPLSKLVQTEPELWKSSCRILWYFHLLVLDLFKKAEQFSADNTSKQIKGEKLFKTEGKAFLQGLRLLSLPDPSQPWLGTDQAGNSIVNLLTSPLALRTTAFKEDILEAQWWFEADRVKTTRIERNLQIIAEKIATEYQAESEIQALWKQFMKDQAINLAVTFVAVPGLLWLGASAGRALAVRYLSQQAAAGLTSAGRILLHSAGLFFIGYETVVGIGETYEGVKNKSLSQAGLGLLRTFSNLLLVAATYGAMRVAQYEALKAKGLPIPKHVERAYKVYTADVGQLGLKAARGMPQAIWRAITYKEPPMLSRAVGSMFGSKRANLYIPGGRGAPPAEQPRAREVLKNVVDHVRKGLKNPGYDPYHGQTMSLREYGGFGKYKSLEAAKKAGEAKLSNFAESIRPLSKKEAAELFPFTGRSIGDPTNPGEAPWAGDILPSGGMGFNSRFAWYVHHKHFEGFMGEGPKAQIAPRRFKVHIDVAQGDPEYELLMEAVKLIRENKNIYGIDQMKVRHPGVKDHPEMVNDPIDTFTSYHPDRESAEKFLFDMHEMMTQKGIPIRPPGRDTAGVRAGVEPRPGFRIARNVKVEGTSGGDHFAHTAGEIAKISEAAAQAGKSCDIPEMFKKAGYDRRRTRVRGIEHPEIDHH